MMHVDPKLNQPSLLRRGWLAGQPADFSAALIARGRLRRFRRGEVLHREGDPPGGIYGIVSGGIGMITVRPDGESVLGHILRPGDWAGQGPAMGVGQRTLTFRATEESEVLCVALVALQALVHDHPGAARLLGTLAESSSARAVTVISELLIPHAERRIAAVLLRATGVLDGHVFGPHISFIMSQTDIGEMANASRNHVNRTLQRFHASGWVGVGYNRIAILDAAALRDFIGSRDG